MSTKKTSNDAHQKIKPSAAALRAKVHHFICSRGDDGATDQEVQTALGMSGNTQRPRRWELMSDGMVKDSGRVRPTESGRDAVVWVCVRDQDEQNRLRAAAQLEAKRREIIFQILEELDKLTLPELEQTLADLKS